MKATLSLEEVKVLILRTIESETPISIQQRAKDSVSFAMNLLVSKCVPIHNGIQFHVNGGYINLEFPDDFSFEDGEAKETLYDLELIRDDDKPEGYWLRMDEATLFFKGERVVEILKRIKSETQQYLQQKKQEYKLRQEADRMIPKEIWASIDNMIEK
ncbi:hypothetical protein [Neobacillus drentensis]|uniref:hypothetical protein n=1 Tax=Neobacillus drentensis TaxID=220684 RepID=UPI003000ED50